MKVCRIVTAGATALAASAIVGTVPPAVQASSASTATWTKQHPATSPPAREDAAMAYDAATGTAVLFGGSGDLDDTWTWNGATWTQQHPATSPPARQAAAMAYDAATGTVVLFGGFGSSSLLGDTWTWNGTTWTQQHPATSPSIRGYAAAACDVATGTVVLFGGERPDGANFRDTWTWNGTTWTQQHQATSPRARQGTAMAYDAVTGAVVLFGGFNSRTSPNYLGDTWTWDGTTWTKQQPAAHPSARDVAAVADAATGTVVLFGGGSPDGGVFGDTWTWG